MKRRAVAVLLLVSLCVLFCACEEPIPVSPNINPAAPSVAQTGYPRLDELADYDYGGREFRIAVYQPDTVFPENSDTMLDNALAARNESVQEKFNIKLKNAGIPQETFFSDLRDAYDAGEDVCDIVVAPRSMLSSFVAGDMLLNVNSLPYVNYSKTYFDSDAMQAASLGAVTYEIAGDFVYSPESYWAVCYNQNLMEWFGFTDFVTWARNDMWTWDRFNEYVDWFYKDENYDRVMTDVDRFGSTASVSDEALLEILWASSGIEFFDTASPASPKINYDTEETQAMIKAVKTALETPGRYTSDMGKKSPLQLFLDEQCLFYICPVSTIGYLQLQGMNVGMLPLPKLSEKQEHFYGYVDPSAPVVFVLNNCADTEFVGRVVQGLFAASDSMTFDSVVQIYSANHLTGNASLNFFIDMIKHGYYDPSCVLGEAFPEVYAASFRIVEDVIYRKGDFRALYDNQLIAFNEAYAEDSVLSEEDGE